MKQWGTAKECADSQDYRTFNIAFNQVHFCTSMGKNYDYVGEHTWIYAKNNTQFIICSGNNYGGNNGIPIGWFAIGN